MITRKHKDRLFSFIYGREEHKDWTLELYNAVNESSYSSPDIEVKVRLININYGRNVELMNRCDTLKEYSWLIARIHEKCEKLELEQAVDRAISELPDGSVLKPLLLAHRAKGERNAVY